jgi:hypothetical protein
MTRRFANIFCAIWDDDDFCELSSDAQRTYFMLFTQPDITACGTLALTLKRWKRTLREKDRDSLEPALAELAEHRFIVIDKDTEELLVRTFVKHDGGYKHAKRVLAVIAYAEAIRSQSIRNRLAIELLKLGVRTAYPLPIDSQPNAPGLPIDSQPLGNGLPIGSLRDVVKLGEYEPHPETRNREREPMPSENDGIPPMFCPKHPDGTDGPCGPCGTAKLRYKAAVEAKLAGEVEAKAAAAKARKACGLCDDLGLRLDPDTKKPLARCNHQDTP